MQERNGRPQNTSMISYARPIIKVRALTQVEFELRWKSFCLDLSVVK